MSGEHWLALLIRHTPAGERPGWDEVIVGYDFGFLAPETILAWVRRQGAEGPACLDLLALEGIGMLEFEATLWDACAESTGKVPRPGSRRWERAQDRWRLALLKDALDAPLTLQALGLAVEAIYERVGCPEDMLGLWRKTGPGKEANLAAIAAFLDRQERRLAENCPGHPVKTC
ncbi:hypothetical protein [Holophaga foetida]|uniref:hypothetical protein n=1 Tax=Holophaga foetida TaxID=35839 RepID=UPI000247215F|nr:hypothetical protein [Holophaga foetida]